MGVASITLDATRDETHLRVTSVVLLAFVGALAIHIVYYCYISPLSSIPGPFEAKLSRSWMVRQIRSGQMHHTIMNLHKKYGSLVRVAPNEVSVTDPDAVKQIYGASFLYPQGRSAKGA
jgi:hypothetical protein